MIWRLGLTLVLAYAMASAPAAAAPSLALNPTKGPPNSVVTFDGSGYCGTCGAVSLTFNNFPVAASIAVSANGTFHGTFEVPAGPAGSQRVVATQPGSGNTATALYFVGPSLPGPTGPQPTVSFVPPAGPTPPITTVPQSEPPQTSPAPVTTTSSAASDAAADQSSQSNGGWGWPSWLLLGVVVVAAATGAVLLQRRRARR